MTKAFALFGTTALFSAEFSQLMIVMMVITKATQELRAVTKAFALFGTAAVLLAELFPASRLVNDRGDGLQIQHKN